MHSTSHSISRTNDTDNENETKTDLEFKPDLVSNSNPNKQYSAPPNEKEFSRSEPETDIKYYREEPIHVSTTTTTTVTIRDTGAIPTQPNKHSTGSVLFPQSNAETRANIRRAQRDAFLRRRKLHLQAGTVIRSNVDNHGVSSVITNRISSETERGEKEVIVPEISSTFRSPTFRPSSARDHDRLIQTKHECTDRVDNNHKLVSSFDNNVDSCNQIDCKGVVDVQDKNEDEDVDRVDSPYFEKKNMNIGDMTPSFTTHDVEKQTNPTKSSRLERSPSNLSFLFDGKIDEQPNEAKVEPIDATVPSNQINYHINKLNLCNWNDLKQKKSFLMAPCPKATGIIQCYVKRSYAALFPEYRVYLKGCDTFLMKSKKRPKKQSSNYLISIDRNDNEKKGANVIGKLRANFIGTEFQIYDAGQNPKRFDPFSSECRSEEDVRSELGSIIYLSNIMGNRGPRKMRVCINKVDENGISTRQWQPMHEDEGMLQCFKHKSEMATRHLEFYENRQPRWNDEMGAFVLNFNGRVTMASVKNFQLIEEGNPGGKEILQFGRAGKNDFAMDVQYPMSLFQAFAIILSACDSKIACD